MTNDHYESKSFYEIQKILCMFTHFTFIILHFYDNYIIVL